MSTFDITKSWLEDEDEDEVEVESQPARRATKEKIRTTDSREISSNRKKSKPNVTTEAYQDRKPPKKPIELETDTEVLQRRQKQIDYGKNTVGYHNYITQVPIETRTKDQPKTPDKYTKYSRRSWDTLIKMWRKKLHEFDDSND